MILLASVLYFFLYLFVYYNIISGFSVSLICSGIYLSIMLFFISGIFRLRKNKQSGMKKFSIIVAARNEEKNIVALLERLKNQNYPKDLYEIIIVNDRSTDKTQEMLEKFDIENLKIVNITKPDENLVGKKNAIAKGIAIAEYDYFAFTDADCLPSSGWLKELNSHVINDRSFVAGYSPLQYEKNSFFTNLKNLERSSIFAVTSGSFGWGIPLTTTARNMCYSRKLFDQVNGFSGIGHISSGDDDLMLLKMRDKIDNFQFMFSQESIIPAKEIGTVTKEINQETRRGSKFFHYPIYLKILVFTVFIYFLYSLKIIVDFGLHHITLTEFLAFYLTKLLHEFSLLFIFLYKVKRLKLLSTFIIAELFYVPYFIFFGIKGTLGKYKWKN